MENVARVILCGFILLLCTYYGRQWKGITLPEKVTGVVLVAILFLNAVSLTVPQVWPIGYIIGGMAVAEILWLPIYYRRKKKAREVK